jgi:hypothetical protein
MVTPQNQIVKYRCRALFSCSSLFVVRKLSLKSSRSLITIQTSSQILIRNIVGVSDLFGVLERKIDQFATVLQSCFALNSIELTRHICVSSHKFARMLMHVCLSLSLLTILFYLLRPRGPIAHNIEEKARVVRSRKYDNSERRNSDHKSQHDWQGLGS